jgi:alpha-N-arabinofuranosidase
MFKQLFIPLVVLAVVQGCASVKKEQEPVKPAAQAAATHIDAGTIGAPISKYVYGQFIEHLGRCIYSGIWAEMLEDRKFFYPVGTGESPWRVVGLAEMIKEKPYVGEHTPRLTGPAGMTHGGLGLIAGKTYDGRIILAGCPKAGPVEVALVWGEGPNNRQTVRLDKLTADFVKYPLQFTAGASTDEGRLEIVVRGKGVVDVGTVSLMPSDNVHGMRPDTLALLKELDAPIYRWPGGNFVSGYTWTDGIGDPDRRPPRKNPAWKGVEHNDFGIDEYMVFCRELGTETYVVVNSGLGGVDMALQELEYANGAQDTPMGALRTKNGHAEPYGVVYWGVGNEMYGDWQLGHMPLEEYTKKHNTYAEAMRAKDPKIKLVGVGATGKWSETMLAQCGGNMELLSEHFYVQDKKDLLAHVRQVPDQIRQKVKMHRRYHESIPGLAGKPVPICMDEWNYWYGPDLYGEIGTRYFLRDALGIAAGFHEYYRASDVVFMANYAQTVNVIGAIKTSKTAAAFDTTGLVLKLYRQQFGVLPVKVETTGSDVDVMAAWTEDKSALTVGVVNATDKPQRLPLAIDGATIAGNGTRWVIAGTDPMAFNEPGKPAQVQIQEEPVSGAAALDLPPMSICLYRLPVK